MAESRLPVGRVSLLITEHRGRMMLHVVSAKYRSKWLELACFCKRPRKDGTCPFTDNAVAIMRPEVRPRVRFAHPKVRKSNG